MDGLIAMIKDRIAWIDAARGLGILAVVAGHTFTEPDFKRAMFLFHMPFFFFLSGLLYRAPDEWIVFALRRSRSLLLPYFAFLATIAAFELLLSRWDGILSVPSIPSSMFRFVLGGTFLSGSETVYWFVPCLLWTTLLYAWLERRVNGPTKFPLMFLMAISYTIAMILPKNLPTPLGIGQIPFALVFYWLGHVFARWRTKTTQLLIAPIGFAASIPWAPAIDVKHLVLGIPVISVVVAAAGTLTLVLLAQVVARTKYLTSYVVLLGRASLVIMFVHMLVIMHARSVLPEVATFALAVILPLAVFLVMERGRATRIVFLGAST